MRFSVSMDEKLLEEFDRWIAKSGFPTRSEALRQLIRTFVTETKWKENVGEVWGTVTVTYNHHDHDASQALTHLQHTFGEVIICTTHIHMDADNCLEVIILRGEVQRVREFVESLPGLKGVRNTTPSITS